jgi:integrase/recombinase XerD
MTSLNLYLGQFLAYLTDVRGRAASTRQAYDGDLGRFITYLEAQGVTEPEQVNTEMIENYIQQQQTTMTTKARTRSAITTYLRFLIHRGVIAVDPCLNLETIKVISKEPAYLSSDQCRVLLAAAKRSTHYYRARDVAIISVFLKSGIRRAELASLNIEDVNLEVGTMNVLRKGGERQTLPLHQELRADLVTYIATTGRTSGPLFLSKQGKRLSVGEIWHLVRKYARQAGLPSSTSCHTLRHSWASTMLAQDFPLRYIQTLLNHKSLDMTAKYLHSETSQVRSALELVSF